MPALLRIDHAFVEGVEVVDVRAMRVRGSDHRALVIDLGKARSGEGVGNEPAV